MSLLDASRSILVVIDFQGKLVQMVHRPAMMLETTHRLLRGRGLRSAAPEGAAGGTLTNHESVAFEWARHKDHPTFKAVSALFKEGQPG